MAKNYQRLVKHQVSMAGIPYRQSARAISMILEALRSLRVIQKTSDSLYCPMRGVRVGPRPAYSHAGRPNNEAEATYLISVLRYVWSKTKNKKPTANRRGYPDTPFVQFAEPLLQSVGIYNTLDNLSRYSRSTKHLRI